MPRFNSERFLEIKKELEKIKEITLTQKKDYLLELSKINNFTPIDFYTSIFCSLIIGIIVFVIFYGIPHTSLVYSCIWAGSFVVAVYLFISLVNLKELKFIKIYNKDYKIDHEKMMDDLKNEIEKEETLARGAIMKEREEIIQSFAFRLITKGVKQNTAFYYSEKLKKLLGDL